MLRATPRLKGPTVSTQGADSRNKVKLHHNHARDPPRCLCVLPITQGEAARHTIGVCGHPTRHQGATPVPPPQPRTGDKMSPGLITRRGQTHTHPLEEWATLQANRILLYTGSMLTPPHITKHLPPCLQVPRVAEGHPGEFPCWLDKRRCDF